MNNWSVPSFLQWANARGAHQNVKNLTFLSHIYNQPRGCRAWNDSHVMKFHLQTPSGLSDINILISKTQNRRILSLIVSNLHFCANQIVYTMVICASCCSKVFFIYQKRDYHLQKGNAAFNLKVMLLGGWHWCRIHEGDWMESMVRTISIILQEYFKRMIKLHFTS